MQSMSRAHAPAEESPAAPSREPHQAAPSPRLAYARVVRAEGPTHNEIQGAPVAARFTLDLDGQPVPATRAISCLVEPLPGDRVLASSPVNSEPWFILSVIDRPVAGETVLSADGDLAIRLPSGKLDLAARDGAKVTTGGAVDITASSFVVSALETLMTSDRMALSARATEITSAGLTIAAEAIDTVADRVTEKIKRAYRKIEELDQLRAQCADYVIKESLRIHSKHTVVSAEEAAKIDAKNVYLG